MFSERGQRRCCNAVRTTLASDELSSFTMRIRRSALPPGVEPFDFTFDHQREHFFLAQRQDAQNDRRDGDDRAGEQRPHEEAAFGEEAHHGLECFGHGRKANSVIISLRSWIKVKSMLHSAVGSVAIRSGGMGGMSRFLK